MENKEFTEKQVLEILANNGRIAYKVEGDASKYLTLYDQDETGHDFRKHFSIFTDFRKNEYIEVNNFMRQGHRKLGRGVQDYILSDKGRQYFESLD